MVKKLLALFLIVLISIESFGAVIGDNDGSAFITKAEFDSLKNSFQSQIDQYNTSIDAKIDGAISSYLAGIRVARKRNAALLFPVTTSSSYKVLSVEDGYNTIAKQTFQGGTYLNSLFTDYSITWPAKGYEGLAPSNGNWNQAGWAGLDWNWTWLSLLGRSYYDQMEGYVFSKDKNEILTKKYAYDNCKLNLAMTSAGNQNYGAGGAGERMMTGIYPGTLTGKRINITYTSTAGIGHGNTRDDVWAARYDGWFTEGALDATTVEANWCDVLPVNKAYRDKYVTQYTSTAQSYPEDTINATYRLTHESKNEDKNLYIYTSCHDVIYAYEDGATEIEEYSDYMDKINSLPNKDDLKIGGALTNVYISDITSKWAWSRAPWNGTAGKPQFIDPVPQDKIIGPRRNWRFTPKFKLKNTSTEVLPNTPSVTGGTNYWNTLNQFKNGYLEFNDYEGLKQVPHFYGGLPLYSFGSDLVDEWTFDLQITPTTTTSPIPTEICIQIKKSEFPNENDISSFSSDDLNALVPFTGTYNNTVYNYDVTNHYLKIPVDKKVSIKLTEPERKTTYYIRWWENGNTNFSGGKIVELNNSSITIT